MKGERSWQTETFRVRWLPLWSARQEQHLWLHVRISTADDRWNKKTVATVPALLKKMAIGTWHMNRFLAILGRPSLSNFSCRPRMSFFNGPQWLLLECITSTYFYWTFMLNCPRGQTQAIPVQIHCQYAGGAGASCPWLPARRILTLLLPYHTLLLPYHTFFWV